MQATNENINRIYWHSRRGMWELDIILVPFVKSEFGHLNADEQQLYIQLLGEEDTDLFDWLVKKYIAPTRYVDLIAKILNFSYQNHAVPH